MFTVLQCLKLGIRLLHRSDSITEYLLRLDLKHENNSGYKCVQLIRHPNDFPPVLNSEFSIIIQQVLSLSLACTWGNPCFLLEQPRLLRASSIYPFLFNGDGESGGQK